MAKYLDETGLGALWAKVKALVTSSIANKVDKVTGKQLSTNDYTTAEKTKLAGVATSANNYIHPANHPATVITEDASHRFATDTEKSGWNGHVASRSNPHAVTKAQVGLGNVDNTSDRDKPVSYQMQTALENRLSYINMPSLSYDLSIMRDVGYYQFNKGCTFTNVGEFPLTLPLTKNIMIRVSKVDSYTNSSNAVIDIVTQEITVSENSYGTPKYVIYTRENAKPAGSQPESATWSQWYKYTGLDSNNLAKLNGIADEANKYIHPSTHAATIITEDASHRFATDTEKSGWNAKASTAVVTTAANGLMIAADKVKLNSFGAASTYALKADIVGMYKYKGTVADATKLPTSGQVLGDVYSITAASAYGGPGANVAWDGTKWDSLGEIFTIATLTAAEVNAICV